MAGTMIDELFVQLSTKGLDVVTTSLTQLQSGLGQVKSVIDKVSQGFQIALAPAAALTATITGLALAGFQGTVQMQQLQFNFQLMTREIASIMVPVIELVTRMFQRLWMALAKLGGDGQRFLMAIAVGVAAVAIGLGAVVTTLTLVSAAIGIVIGVASVLTVVVGALAAAVTGATGGLNLLLAAFSLLVSVQFTAYGAAVVGTMGAISGVIGFVIAYSQELRSSLWMVIEAFGNLISAAWPIVKVFLAIGAALLDSFVVQPLINFANWLTMILMIAEKLIAKFIAMVPIIGRIASLVNFGGGKRTETTLNQTGEESASGSFQRIQQATLQATAGAEQSPIEANTDALKAVTEKVDMWIQAIEKVQASAPSVETITSGATAAASAISSPLGMAISVLRGRN